MKNKIIFCTYGDGPFINSRERIVNEAKQFHNIFNDIYGFTKKDIPLPFIEKTKPYILEPRGSGYWLWKPCFIKQIFDNLNENDILVYADAGCHFNNEGKKRLEEYIDLINTNKAGTLCFEHGDHRGGFSQNLLTTEAIFEHFKIELIDNFRKEWQIMATIFFLRKCETTKQIVNTWYDTAYNYPDLFSDVHNEVSKIKNPVFKDNRHDQSIFSVVAKLNKAFTIPDETYALNWNDIRHVPIWSTRTRS